MDSIPLFMKKVVEKPENCHSDEWILNQLNQRINSLKENNGEL
jgi:formylmethanofuran dehydrogenase subunit B